MAGEAGEYSNEKKNCSNHSTCMILYNGVGRGAAGSKNENPECLQESKFFVPGGIIFSHFLAILDLSIRHFSIIYFINLMSDAHLRE
jgi:hypothetical protein